MRKQVLRTVLATATAFSIATMPALTVCAEDYQEPIQASGKDIKIDGDVSVSLDEDHRYVNDGISASNGKVTITGNVVVDNENKKLSDGVGAGNGTVEIGGDYTFKSGGEDQRSAVATGEDGKIIINGSVNSDAAGISVHEADIYVRGDLNVKTYGVKMDGYGSDSTHNVVIGGTVNTENESAFKLCTMTYPGRDCATAVNALPNVAVYGIDTPDDVPMIDVSGVSFYGPVDKEEQAKELTELFTAAINYIIRTEGGEISFSGDGLKTASDFGITDPDKNFTTTRYGEVFTATVASNYVVEGNNSVEVTKISDGVFSVKLIDKKGGILLAATALSPDPTPGPNPDQPVVIIIPDNGSGSESSDSSSGSVAEPVSFSAIPTDAIAISLPGNAELTATAAVANGPAVLGASREPARAVTLKMTKLTDAQYKDAVIKNIGATPAGGLFRMETDRIATLDRAMLEAFAKRENVDMEVLFPLGSKKISVVIPAGYDINKLLDNKGYCGYLRLLALLGGEIVTQ